MTQQKPDVPVILGIDQPRLTIHAMHPEGALMIAILVKALEESPDPSLHIWAGRIKSGITASFAYQSVVSSIFADFTNISEVSMQSHESLEAAYCPDDDDDDDAEETEDPSDDGSDNTWH